MHCRNCQTKLTNEFINLGQSPVSNSLLKPTDDISKEEKYPLLVYVCDQCFLAQLDEFKKAEDIFSEDYVYFSSFSTSWLKHSKEYVEHIINDFKLNSDSFVVEVASNDGYLLQYFKEKNVPVLGIEPTANTAQVAIDKGIPCISEFFGAALATKLAGQGKKADLILGNNVLAHVPDILDFVSGLPIMLKEDGFVTFEFPHLVRLMQLNQFDTVYHEHFSYLSLYAVERVFEKCGLRVFDVKELPTHGGSLRVYASHNTATGKDKFKATTGLTAVQKSEADFGINNIKTYQNFQPKIEKVRADFLAFLKQAKADNKQVVGYGAAAKGNTFMNYCDLNSTALDYVVDANPVKQGKLLPGTHIPVVSEAEIKKSKPDYVVILPWNIKNEIFTQLAYIKDWGGQFVVSIPALEII